jgi:16S rRNA processing protein RimM
MMEELLQVGAITSPHGLKGEVKVFPTTDDPKRFLDLKTVLFDVEKLPATLTITNVKFVKNMVILKFKHYNHIEEAERLRGKLLYITRDQAVPCEEDEYFIADLIGMEVATFDGEPLGHLDHVMQTGANDVYVVKKEGQKDLLIPVIKECIKDINPKEKRITVHLLKGLRE